MLNAYYYDTPGTYSQLDIKWKKFIVTDNDNGQIVTNLIPCYRISDNRIGMYDAITDTFYENAGGSNLIAGPAV